ncbi:MAG: NIPSNAP family protein [Opitutaceae bacterium]
MKTSRLGSSLLLAGALTVAATFAPAAEPAGLVYELRTYTTHPGKLPDLMARFRDHTRRIFEKHGMVNVAYWVPTDAKDGAGDKLVYLLSHKSRDAATASWKAFSGDSEWKDVAAKSEKNGKIVAKVERLFLSPTDFSRAMDSGNRAGGPPRVFELRTYTTPEGKLAALDARFRDHTLALFAKHGITNLGYFHPTDADKGAANTLVYFIAHANRDAATASWKNFRDDPVWAKARTASEANGKLTTKVESVFLTAVDFSAVK